MRVLREVLIIWMIASVIVCATISRALCVLEARALQPAPVRLP